MTSTGGVQITKDVHSAIPTAKLFGPDGLCSGAWADPKQGGVPLYQLARAGKAVEALPRKVTVHAIDVLDMSLPEVVIDGESVDIALGGGGSSFDKEKQEQGNIRTPKNLPELEKISGWQRPRVIGLFAENDLPFSDEPTARTEKPSLADMVRRAIEVLQVNRRGYVLVVDAHLMASAAWQNQGERTLRETLELDHAIRTAREFGGANVAIVVCGDVAIGGMNVNTNNTGGYLTKSNCQELWMRR